MTEDQMSQTLLETFDGVDVVHNMEASFFFYNPPDLPTDHMFPFATIVTSDLHDQYSDLNRPSVYRLNIGVSKQTFISDLGFEHRNADEERSTQIDYTTLDQLMPHPVYARQYWVSIINPSDETFKARVHPLLKEAYDIAVNKRRKPPRA